MVKCRLCEHEDLSQLGVVAHTCNPSAGRVEKGEVQGLTGQPSSLNQGQNPVSKDNRGSHPDTNIWHSHTCVHTYTLDTHIYYTRYTYALIYQLHTHAPTYTLHIHILYTHTHYTYTQIHYTHIHTTYIHTHTCT